MSTFSLLRRFILYKNGKFLAKPLECEYHNGMYEMKLRKRCAEYFYLCSGHYFHAAISSGRMRRNINPFGNIRSENGDFEMLKKDALEEKRIFKILRIF